MIGFSQRNWLTSLPDVQVKGHRLAALHLYYALPIRSMRQVSFDLHFTLPFQFRTTRNLFITRSSVLKRCLFHRACYKVFSFSCHSTVICTSAVYWIQKRYWVPAERFVATHKAYTRLFIYRFPNAASRFMVIHTNDLWAKNQPWIGLKIFIRFSKTKRLKQI